MNSAFNIALGIIISAILIAFLAIPLFRLFIREAIAFIRDIKEILDR